MTSPSMSSAFHANLSEAIRAKPMVARAEASNSRFRTESHNRMTISRVTEKSVPMSWIRVTVATSERRSSDPQDRCEFLGAYLLFEIESERFLVHRCASRDHSRRA